MTEELENNEQMPEEADGENAAGEQDASPSFYRIQFRKDGQQFTASAQQNHLARGTVVMVATDHGPEPAVVCESLPGCRADGKLRKASWSIEKTAAADEQERYESLVDQEIRAKGICNRLIEKHHLLMNLVRVERFFNGGKIIFYFTAENRVDFRALVKDLVQEFRTRVEMRQVGVRHETKMIGGLGACGRELCCSSYLKKFDSVSIKMAKEQDLPLNPSKISGLCNRLLCCLTYEYTTYKRQRKGMPKPGRKILLDKQEFKVKRQIPLQRAIVVADREGDEKTLMPEEWEGFEPVRKEHPQRKEAKNEKTKNSDNS